MRVQKANSVENTTTVDSNVVDVIQKFISTPPQGTPAEIIDAFTVFGSQTGLPPSVFLETVEQAPVAISITDAKAYILYVNSTFEKLTGYQRKEIIGQNESLLSSKSTPVSIYKNLWKIINEGQIWKGTLINNKKRKKLNLKGWDLNANRIRKIYMIHLIIGGIILFFLMSQSLIKLIIPVSLLLYGFSSIFVNKYSLGKTNYLGVVFLANGFLSILLPNQSFLLWSLAFGGYHIIYGVFYFKRR